MQNKNSTNNNSQTFLLEGMDSDRQDNFLPDIDWVKVGVGVVTAAAGGYALYQLKQINDKLESPSEIK